MRREIALRRQLITRRPATGIERAEQVEVDLMVQRDGAELETEAGQPTRSSWFRWPSVWWSCAGAEY
jgi:hypothetical protein